MPAPRRLKYLGVSPMTDEIKEWRCGTNPAAPGVRAVGLIIVLALLMTPRAHAETSPSTSAPAADAGTGGKLSTNVPPSTQLKEIIVVAQKRRQEIENVAIPISAYTGATLQAAGVTNLSALARFTPGLGLSGAFAGQDASISIRGVAQQDFNDISEGPNAVYVDGGYVGINNISALGLFDIDHVEVLKGPQGTLFGRNAIGGLVNILTNDPSDQFGGYVNYTYGSYDTNTVSAAITGPLDGDEVTGRLALLYNQNGAFVRNLAPTGGNLGGENNWGVRGKIDIKPTSNFDALVTGFATRWLTSWGPYFSIPETPVYTGSGALLRQVNSVPSATSLLWPTNTSNPADMTLDAHDALSHGDYFNMQGGDLRMNYEAGSWRITSTSDYKNYSSMMQLDDTAIPVSVFDTYDHADFDQWSQELDAFWHYGTLRVTSGVVYLYMDAKMDPDIQIIEPASYFQGTATQDTKSYAAFSQADWDFARKWTLVLGLRYTDDRRYYNYVQHLCPGFAACNVIFYPQVALSRNDGMISDTARLEYRPREGVLLYVSDSRGAKAGGFNFPLGSTSPAVQPPASLPYKPEYLTDYTLGVKSGWLDDRLQVNADGFYYDYDDYQSFILLPPLTTIVGNNPARTRGAELSIEARPTSRLLTKVDLDRVDNTVYRVDIATLSGMPFYYDKEAPFTSPWQATATVRYVWPFLGGDLSLQGDAKFIGTYYFSLTNYDATRQPDFTLYDLNASWMSPSGRWSVSVRGNNLGNKRYKTVGFDVASLFGLEQVAYGMPRWVSGTVSYHF
jgi:iron complex outermembrane recepter protein